MINYRTFSISFIPAISLFFIFLKNLTHPLHSKYLSPVLNFQRLYLGLSLSLECLIKGGLKWTPLLDPLKKGVTKWNPLMNNKEA